MTLYLVYERALTYTSLNVDAKGIALYLFNNELEVIRYFSQYCNWSLYLRYDRVESSLARINKISFLNS